MNRNDKILVSLVTGIVIGSVLGILLSKEGERKCKHDRKDKFWSMCKEHTKSSGLTDDSEKDV